MDLIKLFSLDYLFEAYPGSDFNSRFFVYAFFGLMLLGSFFVAKMLKNRPFAKLEAEFFANIPSRMIELALLGLLFTFMRDQNVPYLGMRAWLLLPPALLLAYLIYTWRNYKKNFAIKLASKNTRKEEDKYLPKAKKRK